MKSFSQNAEGLLSPDDLTSHLMIYTDKNGDLFFSCDWEDDQDSRSGMSIVFAKLMYDNLIHEILDDLKAQYTITNRLDEFNALTQHIYERKISYETMHEPENNDTIVIPPSDAGNI